ncbi:hypothetical protein [Nocardioides sp. Leaf285]|uniref:hypothetical protein n=1 Tax=Nocardioides sp. Leaf285 TaxID=1736322 RepID=UPI000725F629|nr:hypothetical protein [Nocardioides sp. Leaf285]KQP66978.1 hypothetical protein ASF47_04630 [Nocardioides sp. Leaf285]
MPLVEACRRVWLVSPSGTLRVTSAAVVCGLLTVLQLTVVVLADNRWALLGLVLPVAGGLLLLGWVRQRRGWRALGLLLAVVGAFLPFWLDAATR